MTIVVQTIEKTKPVRKKGSGTIRGPTPRSKFIAVNAALFLGEENLRRISLKPILLRSIIILGNIYQK